MSYRPNPDNQPWSLVKRRLVETLAKWGVGEYWIDCPTTSFARSFDDPNDRFVVVTFEHPTLGHRETRIDRFVRPVDNLWALALGLDAIRLNELRGLDDVARQVYAQLPAPKTRDPYELLGIRPDAPHAVIDAAYRAQAKALHPDRGGTTDAMAGLNAAYDQVRGVAS